MTKLRDSIASLAHLTFYLVFYNVRSHYDVVVYNLSPATLGKVSYPKS